MNEEKKLTLWGLLSTWKPSALWFSHRSAVVTGITLVTLKGKEIPFLCAHVSAEWLNGRELDLPTVNRESGLFITVRNPTEATLPGFSVWYEAEGYRL